MNYIASFIINFLENEKEAFYLFYGIIEHTNYSEIFLDDLFKLKQYFYVFDRLMSLQLPELHAYFKSNSIVSNFFASSWFITLFTNSVIHSLSEKPKILLYILDKFFLVKFYLCIFYLHFLLYYI
jgi:hypothetical protein